MGKGTFLGDKCELITVIHSKFRIINKDIVCFSAGEEHIIFMNSKGEMYGVGNNQYGQLGTRNNSAKSTINRVF